MKKLQLAVIYSVCLLFIAGCTSQKDSSETLQGAYLTGTDYENTFMLLIHPKYPDALVLSGVDFKRGIPYEYLLPYHYYSDENMLVINVPDTVRHSFYLRGAVIDTEVHFNLSQSNDILACFSDCPKGLPVALQLRTDHQDFDFKANYLKLRKEIDPNWSA